MKELKLDLTPDRLRSARNEEKDNERLNPTRAAAESAEPLPESERPRKDGPGGE